MYSADPGKVNSLSQLTDHFPQNPQNTCISNGKDTEISHITCHMSHDIFPISHVTCIKSYLTTFSCPSSSRSQVVSKSVCLLVMGLSENVSFTIIIMTVVTVVTIVSIVSVVTVETY